MSSRLGSLFSSAGSNALSGPTKTQADINVFTVASGHLYEVLLHSFFACNGLTLGWYAEDGNDYDGLGNATHGKLCKVLVHHQFPQSCLQGSCFVLVPTRSFVEAEPYCAELLAPLGSAIWLPV